MLHILEIMNVDLFEYLHAVQLSRVLKLNTRTGLGQLSNLMSVKEVTLDGNYPQSLIWSNMKTT